MKIKFSKVDFAIEEYSSSTEYWEMAAVLSPGEGRDGEGPLWEGCRVGEGARPKRSLCTRAETSRE